MTSHLYIPLPPLSDLQPTNNNSQYIAGTQMMQKIVIKVQIKCKKCRSKAMCIAATGSGVNTVRLEGEENDHVVVIGDSVDAAGITGLLRKKVGRASLESVEEIKDA